MSAACITRHYPGYEASINVRRIIGPYTIHDLGYSKHVWRHGWRRLDEDCIEVQNEARNVCKRLRKPERLPK